jgi:O-antigen/teichoic acid export membrane protein
MKLKQNTLWAIAGGAIPAVAALLSIPVLVNQLGFEVFAIASLIISLNIFFYIYDFGLGRALTFFVPQSESRAILNGLLGTGLIASIVIGILVGMLVYFVTPYMVTHWMKVDVKLLDDAILAFQVASLGILPSVVSNVLKGVLEGQRNFKVANICKIFSGSFIFLAPLILVILFETNSLVEISLSIVVTRYAGMGLYFFYTAREFEFRLIKVSSNAARVFVRYGFWAAISGFFAAMFVYGDRFIVAGYLKPDELSIYIASQDILIRYLLLPWSMAVVLMPVFSARNMQNIEIERLYKKQGRLAMWPALVFLCAVILVVVGVIPHLSTYGIPQETGIVVMIQGIGVFFCALAQLPLIYLYANGRPRLITTIYAFETIFYVGFAPYVFSHYGVIGACAIWSGRLILEYMLLNMFAKRVMHEA